MRKLISYSQVRLLVIFLSEIFLSSCVGAVQMFPTITATPSRTITTTATLTKIHISTATTTDVPEPTLTKTLVPPQVSTPLATSRSPLRLKPAIPIPEAGFSFQSPLGYKEQYEPGRVMLTSEDQDIIIWLIGSPIRRIPDLEFSLNGFIGNIAEIFHELDTGIPYPYTFAGSEGLAVDVNAEWSDTPVEGRIAVVAPNDQQILTAFAISANGGDGIGWEPRGRQVFEAVVGSITLFKPINEQD